jgi:hypothetical protein
MLIPLMVALWERAGFDGVKRTLIEDVADLSNWNFSKRANAIGVHPGPNFNMWTSFTPTVTFLGEDPNAGELILGPGAWSDLSQFGWDNRIVSVTFNLNNEFPTGASDTKTGRHITIPSPPAAPIWRIPLVLDAWTDWEPLPESEGWPPGKRIQVVEDCPSLTQVFGAEFNDSIKTVRVRQGPDYGGYDVVRLCRDDGFLGGYAEYGADGRIGLADWGPYDPYTSSVLFTLPPIHPIRFARYLAPQAAGIDWSAMAMSQSG